MPETKAQIQARIDKYSRRIQEIDAKIAALQTKRELVANGVTILHDELAKAAD